MPFGLTNVPAVSQHMENAIFKTLFLNIYLEDITIMPHRAKATCSKICYYLINRNPLSISWSEVHMRKSVGAKEN